MNLIEKIDAEIWKDVVGYEGLYLISSKGRVKALNYRRSKKPHIMSVSNSPCGYLQVNLWKSGKHKCHRVHRLVADAFIANPSNLPQVNHKDENKKNNSHENLEWCDNSYNSLYGTKQERFKEKMSKPVIGTCIKTGEELYFKSETEATVLGFDRSHMVMCCRGIYKQHRGYRWRYA